MDFLKRHYEKLILTVVLAGLLGAAGRMLVEVEQVGKVDPWFAPSPENLAIVEKPDKYEQIISKLKTPAALDLDRPHPVFNPVVWYSGTNHAGDRVMFPEKRGARDQLRIHKLTPLHLVIEGSVRDGAGRTTLVLGLTREYLPPPGDRRIPREAMLGRVTRLDGDNIRVVVNEVRGEGASAELVVDILVAGEPPQKGILLSNRASFRRVMGYSLDFSDSSDPVAPIVKNRRVGDRIPINGEICKIVAITGKDFTLEAPNTRRTTILTQATE